MPTNPKRGEPPHKYLQRLLDAHDLNPHKLSRLSGGEVSATTVYGWLAAGPKGGKRGPVPPSRRKLQTVARYLAEDGPALLRAYGFDHEAEELESGEEGEVNPGEHVLRYSGRRLSQAEEEAVRRLIEAVKLLGR